MFIYVFQFLIYLLKSQKQSDAIIFKIYFAVLCTYYLFKQRNIYDVQ